MTAIDDVEGRVGMFDVRDVHLLHDVTAVEIRRDVTGAERPLKP
jgi:hypothetical protein